MKLSIDSLKPIYQPIFKILVDPTQKELIEMVNLLDQQNHSILVAEKSALDNITVGGGSKKFILYYQTDYDHFPTLINPQAKIEEGKCSLIVGGQLGEFDNNIINSKEIIIKVLLEYLENKDFFSNYDWS